MAQVPNFAYTNVHRQIKTLLFILFSFSYGPFEGKITRFKYLVNGHPLSVRCSHLPPTQEPITQIWLNNSEVHDSFVIEENPSGDSELDSSGVRSKRHISSRRKLMSDNLQKSSSSRNLPAGPRQSRQMNDEDELIPIKIHIHYDSTIQSLEQQKLRLINETVMPSVVKFFESVLSIKRDHRIDNFKMTRRCPNNTMYYARESLKLSRAYCMEKCEDYAVCGEIIVPKNHLSACSFCNSTSRRCSTNSSSEGEGVSDAQLVLYVSAKQTPRCKKDQTIAYAAHCAQDSRTDRPVAGHANLCPSSISTDPKDLRALIATVKHELTHVLGFSVSLFAYYRDEFGNPLTERDSLTGPIMSDPRTGYAKWSDKIIKKVIRTDWLTGGGKIDKEIHMIVTPTVVREVRNHFNCSTLEGAELEDQGFDGTSMTHWEKRLFENEAMTGTHTQNSVYSRITLAVLQDTGWYIANFSRAERLDWGKNLGCDFAKKSCKSWISERRAEGKSIRPFCDQVKGDLLQIACTEDRTSKAVCNMKQYKEPLPLAYKNFDSLDSVADDNLTYYGGSVDLADFCPFIQEFTWQTQNLTIRGSRCDSGLLHVESERNAALESYGSQTKCFEHGRRWEQKSCIYKRHWHHYGAGCYKYSCNNGHVVIFVGGQKYSCYYANQIISIEQLVGQWLYNGTLICPACERVCPEHKCRTFDRRLIDQVLELSLKNQRYALAENGVSIYELSNSIDIDYPANLTVTNFIKNHTISSRGTVFASKPNMTFKERLLEMLAYHKEPLRHELLCSDGNRLHINLANILSPFIIATVHVYRYT